MRETLELGRAEAEAVEMALAAALGGDEASARRYARAWRRAVRELLASRPETPGSAADVLDHVALIAPFAPGGPVAALMSAAAGIIPDMTAPAWTGAPARLPDPVDYQRFSRVVLQELSGAGTGLERLLAAWQLSVSDVGRLFGVTRQAVQQWLDDGVPPARQPKLLMVLQIADLLERNLLTERVPAVVRTPASAYGDRSILQAIGDDDHRLVLDAAARSLDWSSTV